MTINSRRAARVALVRMRPCHRNRPRMTTAMFPSIDYPTSISARVPVAHAAYVGLAELPPLVGLLYTGGRKSVAGLKRLPP